MLINWTLIFSLILFFCFALVVNYHELTTNSHEFHCAMILFGINEGLMGN